MLHSAFAPTHNFGFDMTGLRLAAFQRPPLFDDNKDAIARMSADLR